MVEAAAAGDATNEPWQFRETENGKRKTENRGASYGNGLRGRRIEKLGQRVVEERAGSEYRNWRG